MYSKIVAKLRKRWSLLALLTVWYTTLSVALIAGTTAFSYWVLASQAAIDDKNRADKASAVLALVGAINVPIIYFSVKWWNTLHQGASVSLMNAPAMAAVMLKGMLVMAIGFWLYSIAVILIRVRCEILERDSKAAMFRQD